MLYFYFYLIFSVFFRTFFRLLSILLLWTPSLKYCRNLKGEYKNLKSGSGTSVGPIVYHPTVSFFIEKSRATVLSF